MKISGTECTPPAPRTFNTDQGYRLPASRIGLKRENRVSTSSVALPQTITLAPARAHTIPSFASFISHNQPSSMFALFSKIQDDQPEEDESAPATPPTRDDTSKTSLPGRVASPKKATAQIDPVDGKTKTCDRGRTFETFVDVGKLTADLGVTEAVGSSSDARRGLGKVRGWVGRRKGPGC
ncbi:uncharacterized protein CC84DRAFT_1177343 [Paraphaeosphaeria sporulosa]|uniref:Uncharacterized protein n=1 Tax=Paraphaeosphaeria sporulosa TaxID=1460663 RepID=A0A177CEW0_9PLEO|nr:uncharacterized protein CC84DRAFT_1177343 [Paraphaeosphaeria sporulosa]OAG05270.1 hypothetical protein CC84DRAFT_1177343 [Paraphaeosphaeria sporulosa]